MHDLVGRILGQQHTEQQNTEKKKCHRRSKTSVESEPLCPHSQRIDQQSHKKESWEELRQARLNTGNSHRNKANSVSAQQPGAEADTRKHVVL